MLNDISSQLDHLCLNHMVSMHTHININFGQIDNCSTLQQLNSCSLSHVLSDGAAGKWRSRWPCTPIPMIETPFFSHYIYILKKKKK